jgi:hypothetical protein
MRQLSEQLNGAKAICKLLESGVASENHGWKRRLWISAPLRRTKNWARKLRAGLLLSDEKSD